MAESAAARVKAAQLRQRVDAGKPISADNKRFLDDYVKRTAFSKAKALPAPSSPSSPRLVQSTEAQNDNVDPSAHTWTPTVPEQPPDAPPPPAGAPPPATPGAPIVDTAAPTGDPKAAAQAAVLAALITRAGIKAALELAADMQVPEDIRALATDPATQNELVGQVAAAAHRLALKYNVQSIPLSDELIVGGAVAASAAAYIALLNRRKKAKAVAAPKKEEPTSAKPDDDGWKPAPPPPGVSWS